MTNLPNNARLQRPEDRIAELEAALRDIKALKDVTDHNAHAKFGSAIDIAARALRKS